MKKKTLQQQIADLNNKDMNDYLQLVGCSLIRSGATSSVYTSPFDAFSGDQLIVIHETNTFTDQATGLQGQLVDFITEFFRVTPEEIISNIMPYRLHMLN